MIDERPAHLETHARPPPMTRATVAYLNSVYARASHTFIRTEVSALRRLGREVRTFSVHRAAPEETVAAEVADEERRTVHLLDGPASVALAALATLVAALRAPARMAAALALAIRLGWPGLKGRIWPLLYLAEAALLASHLRRERIAHLHVHGGQGAAAVGLLAATLARARFSMTVHGPFELERAPSMALDVKIARAAFVVAISEHGRGLLLRWSHPRDWPKIAVVRCAADARFQGQPPTPISRARRLVCVARLVPEKGLRLLVEATAELARAGVELEVVLIGDGPLRGDLEALIAREGLEARVRLVGWLSSDRVREEILASRALVLPSLIEGLPIVAMEALALGRPIIATSVGAMAELARDGECGWIVPAGSVARLSAAMRAALEAEPAELERLGKNGAARVAEEHDPARQAGRLEELFLASERGPTLRSP